MDNIHKKLAATLTDSQRSLLNKLEEPSKKLNPMLEFMPYRNADDADRLFDLHCLVAFGFATAQVLEVIPRTKLAFHITMTGIYARSVLLNKKK